LALRPWQRQLTKGGSIAFSIESPE